MYTSIFMFHARACVCVYLLYHIITNNHLHSISWFADASNRPLYVWKLESAICRLKKLQNVLSIYGTKKVKTVSYFRSSTGRTSFHRFLENLFQKSSNQNFHSAAFSHNFYLARLHLLQTSTFKWKHHCLRAKVCVKPVNT